MPKITTSLGKEEDYPARGPALQAALPALEGRLTCLALPGTIVGQFAPPSLLTACSGLQALFVIADAKSSIAALPPGPALPSLRYLTGPLTLVASSLDVLQAATQLQFVGTMCFLDEFASFSKLLDWASKHPTLRRLALCGRRDELDSYTAQVSIAFAQRQNPTLCITRHPQPYLRADPEQFLAECGFDAFYNHPGF